ncbi:hypothetical protein FACS1894191_8070 [Clostridia bacterium]|nr:hypothetical protein FACS1894191_8070 [Clostridia bacterium]
MNFREVKAIGDKNVKISVAAGHFATNHSHINYYIDLTDVKSLHKMAKRAAVILADKYRMTNIDTVICLEGTEVIGAFLAEELAKTSLIDMNSGVDISIIAPEMNSNNQMIFRDNSVKMIHGKDILLLIASLSTGKTVSRALDCISYYEGRLAGISAVFSAIGEVDKVPVNSVFTTRELSDYQTFVPKECEMCADRLRLDAIVNSYGFSKL